MTRLLRDRAAEAMREARLGRTRFQWDFCDQEEWHRSFDAFVRIGKRLGFSVVDAGEEKPSPAPPASNIITSILDARDPQIERALRYDGDGNWSVFTTNRLSHAQKTLLTFTVDEVDRDCDLVLAGDPAAQGIRGILTRVAAANLIRKLNAESMEPK